MCSCRAFLCCSALPASVLVVLAAVVLPQLAPKDSCARDAAGVCKRIQGGEPVSCDGGIFLELAKQPGLGLLHLPVKNEETGFASLVTGGCTWRYSLACAGNNVEVRGSSACGDRAVQRTPLGDLWEVCAEGAELSLLLPIVDATFDIETTPGQRVEGCVRISAPRRHPRLGAVRGPVAEQTAALVARKREVGGCPTWVSEEDRLARSQDYAGVFGRANGWFVKQLLEHTKEMALEYKAGRSPPSIGFGTVFKFAGAGVTGGGHAGGAAIATMIYCGMPGPAAFPALNGIQVTRHAEVSELIADPNQKRVHQIGGGNSEVCFEPTLPVFLSAGSPPHTQVRKLWDAVGVATMHLGDLPDITPPPESIFFKVRKAALGAVGIHTTFLDELALYVTPVFLEKLWGRKPTEEEAAVIASYGTLGGPCIMSQIVEKLPVVPGKIRAIRAAAVAFARESPVGRKMAEEIHKPEYAELKALYAARPMGVVDGALGALADASLFAGLIGTSTMTMNALMQVRRGPQFVKMFRENSTAFMLEVMRTATAVAGSIQATKKPWKLVLAGEDVELPAGEKIFQMTGIAAGLDGSVFPEPFKFDSRRPNLGETMNFNGLTKHVLARDYAGAPRFCPGAALSIKIASQIVNYLTKDLPEL